MLLIIRLLLVSVSLSTSFAFAANQSPKIYDCFLFYNELDLLEVKLNELYNYVDYFVIVESVETFRGNPKPLYFQENKERYAKFTDKIIHVVLTEKQTTDNPWEREEYQRNQISRGLFGCKLNDIVIIEDADEIVRSSKVSEIVHLLTYQRFPYVFCRQNIYIYYLNRCGQLAGEVTSWVGSGATTYTNLKYKTPTDLRWKIPRAKILDDAGWHFTYMGGISKIQLKVESFSHSELDNDIWKNPCRINSEIKSLKIAPIDESYPRYIQENIDYFKKIGFVDT